MEQQACVTQLCLDVQSATLLPGCHKTQDVRVRTQTLVVPGLPHTTVPLTFTSEALSRTLDCIPAAVLVALHLEDFSKGSSSQQAQISEALAEIGLLFAGIVHRIRRGGLTKRKGQGCPVGRVLEEHPAQRGTSL